MKWGILISIVIIALFSALVFFNMRGVSDQPTAATSPENLRAVVLPASLPELYTSTHPGDDSTKTYYEAINLYNTNKDAFTSSPPMYARVDEMTNLLIQAADEGAPRAGWLDKYIDLEPGAEPKFGAAVEIIPNVVLQAAAEAHEDGNTTRAKDAASAVFAMGHRMYTKNTRFYNRFYGLQVMSSALGTMAMWKDDLPDGGESIDQWFEELNEIFEQWEAKMQIVKNLRGHVADTVNIALNDEELTFRIAATLNLGVLKFAPGSKGNVRLIEETFATLKQDDNQLVAEAAETAEKIKKEEINMMK